MLYERESIRMLIKTNVKTMRQTLIARKLNMRKSIKINGAGVTPIAARRGGHARN